MERGYKMSGGGGGGYGPVSPSGPCDRLTAETAVQSPNPAVIDRLAPGQLLRVVLENNSVFVFLDQERLGSLIFRGLPRLIECLQQGNEYLAEITKVSGPDCMVKVRPQ